MSGRQVLRETLMDAYRGVPPVPVSTAVDYPRRGGRPAEFPLVELISH